VALLTPAFLLIDHGHFQYNNVMLGFTLWSLAMFAMQRYCLSVVFLMLSIAFKQMNIYSVPAFGAALLGIGMSGGTFKSTIISYFKYGIFAVLTLAACFGPFLESKETIVPVLHRLFPVNRGLFEEKVANFWCSLAILTKFHRKHSNEQLFRYCLLSVLTVLIPISLGFVVKGMRKGGLGIVAFLRGLSLVCLSMYLFSYHVHEKQILIPLLPITFLLSDSPWFVYFFTSWASFSLFPLMKKDNLQVAYFAVCLAWNCVFFLSNSSRRIGGLWKFLIFISLDFILVNHAVQVFWTPPAKYPDLFLVLNTLSSSGAFGISAVYLFYKFIFVKN
jgi:alpha-1,3-glucosyltransferase